MDFELKDNPVAGSVDAILKNDDVRAVFSSFGDSCLQHYGLDIRQKKSMYNARTLKQVRSFVEEFGREDSLRIIGSMFSASNMGLHNGKPLGVSIFAQSYRWLANQYLLDAYSREKSGGMSWTKL